MFQGLFLASAVTQHARAAEAGLNAQKAASAANEARRQAESLTADVDKLFMITQALWELLKAEHGYTDELLMKRITEIDLRDGRLDGKLAKTERPNCSSCGRKLGRAPICIFCGTSTPRDPFGR